MFNLTIQIEEKIFKIERQVDLLSRSDHQFALMGGWGGYILFYFYLFKLTSNSKYHQLAFDRLERSLSTYNYGNLSLCNGLAGINWLIKICHEEKFIECNLDEYTNDCVLLEWTKNRFNNEDFDFLHGGLGSLLYLLDRFKDGTIDRDKIGDVVKTLLHYSISDAEGYWWRSTSSNGNKENKNIYNLGISHGIIGILLVLAKSYVFDILKEDAKEKLDGAIKMLFHFINAPMKNGYYFPYIVDLNERKSEPRSRLAWCYCDLGNSVVLANIASLIKSDILKKRSFEIAKNSTFIANDSLAMDGSICHGAGGNAYMYRLLYLTYNDEIFLDASNNWYIKCLAFDKNEKNDNISNYRVWRPSMNSYQHDIGMLEGVTGVGLSLISSLFNEKQEWSKLLLLS